MKMMKMRYLAMVFAVGLSGPAFADMDTAYITQYGPGNTAQIDQLSNNSAFARIFQNSSGYSEGNDSKVRQENNAGTVDAQSDQTGAKNINMVTQLNHAPEVIAHVSNQQSGTQNTASMLQQDNTGDVSVSYSQKGNGNAAEFSQINNRGNAFAGGGQYGEKNRSTIQQSGNALATANTFQGNESYDRYAIENTALITQTFNQNALAETRQMGTLNDSSITQQNNADTTASVFQGFIFIFGAEANSNYAVILQNQNLGTTASVAQGGTFSSADIWQEQNSGTTAEIFQSWFSSVTWLFRANSAQIMQTYNLDTIARVTQNGEENWAKITQSNNADHTIAEVVQGGGYLDRDSGQWVELGSGSQNQASIGQSNSHNVDARITQEGSLNTASVLQMGSDLVARVAQSGSSNQAAIDQLGIGFRAHVTQNGMANVANVYQR